MSDIRRSILSTTPVLIATDRALRPDDFIKKARGAKKECPFCPGNEHMTPRPELARYQEPGKGWSLRAFPNKFPAARADERSHFLVEPAESIVIINAHGCHEVIVETEVHKETLASVPNWKITNVLEVVVRRMQQLYGDEKIKFVQVFKNHGSDAGASQEHPHFQIIALPHIPTKIEERMHHCRQHKLQLGKDPFEEVLEIVGIHNLTVAESEHFLCYAPYESKVPFEMAIMPKDRAARLEDSQLHFQEMARLLSQAFRRLETVLEKLPPFNLTFEEAPPGVYIKPEEFFRWRWRIIPRLTKMAGFEFGTGYYINPLPPERAAESLRKIKIS